MMEKKPGKNSYGNFDSVSMSSVMRPATVSSGGVRHIVNVPAIRMDERQGEMNKWVVFALSASASFMTTLDGSIVNIGLPSIASTFHVGISGATEWIIIGYLVVIAASLLTFGRLADMIGRKSIFFAGLLIFILGSMLCGLAPSLLTLILA